MTRAAAEHFGPLARSYDALRPQDANWAELLELLVREGDLRGRRVLEVGAGTGALAAALAALGARVWAVDATAEMVAAARERVPPRVRVRQARAEALPFRDGWFERAVGRLVVHLVERPAAFAELRRVLRPDGRAVLATFAPEHFASAWTAPYFPSLAAVDRARFPRPGELERELRTAGFARVRLLRHDQSAALAREDALRRLRGRYISTLSLLPEDELAAGVERAERELPERVEVRLRWLVAVADR